MKTIKAAKKVKTVKYEANCTTQEHHEECFGHGVRRIEQHIKDLTAARGKEFADKTFKQDLIQYVTVDIKKYPETNNNYWRALGMIHAYKQYLKVS
jgi:hypothetical protein